VRRRVDRAAWRFGLFLAVVAVSGVITLVHYHADVPLAPDDLRDAIRGWGRLGPLIFTGVFILRPFLFFPSSLLFLAGGLAFGAGWGTLYAAVGATVGAVVGFAIARILGREFIEARFGARFPALRSAEWGGGVVWLLYLVPVVPMTAINYGAGLSRMALLPFTLAVAAGIAPRAFAYSFFGQSLRHVGSREFLLALGLLAALLVVPVYVRHHLNRRAAGPASPPGG